MTSIINLLEASTQSLKISTQNRSSRKGMFQTDKAVSSKKVIPEQKQLVDQKPTLKKSVSTLSTTAQETASMTSQSSSPTASLTISSRSRTTSDPVEFTANTTSKIETPEKTIRLAQKSTNPETEYFLKTKAAMEAPLEKYTAQLNSEVAKQYSPIPTDLRAEMETFYTIEFINNYATGRLGGEILGYNKVPVEAISLPVERNVAHPNNLQKINAGFEALAESHKKNPLLYKNYDPKTKTIFMAESAEIALAKLRTQFSHAPEKLLQAMEIEFRLAHNNRYQKKYIFFDDITKPIETKAADIIKDPEWPTEKNSEGYLIVEPSNFQKLYAAAKAMETIAVKIKADKKAAENPSYATILSSLPREAFTKGVQAALSNAATKVAIKYVKAAVPEAQPKQPLVYPENFETPMLNIKKPEKPTKPSFSTLGFTGYLANRLKASAQAVQKSPKELTIFVRKTINTIADILFLTKAQRTALQEQGKKEVDIIIKDKESWFYKTGKERDTKLNLWLESLVTKFNTYFGKSNPTDMRIIQIDADSTNPLTPKITLNYNTKTNELISAFVEYKNYKYQVDTKNINFDTTTGVYEITTPLYITPKKLSTQTKFYNFLIKDTVIDPLLQETSAGQGAASVTSGSAKNNTTSTTAESGAQTYLKDQLLAKPNPSEGTLNIKFNKDMSMVKTKVTTKGTVIPNTKNNEAIPTNATPQKAGQIISTKIYNTDSKTKEVKILQNIQLTGPTTDIFASTINIKLNPALTGKEAIEMITIEFTNKMVKKNNSDPNNPVYAVSEIKIDPRDINFDPSEIKFDKTTETLTITTTRLRENAPKTPGLKDAILSMIKNETLQKAAEPANEILQKAAEQALETVENHLSNLSTQAYRDMINNADTSYVPALLRNMSPEIYNAVRKFILEPIPTAIDKTIIELNIPNNLIATRTIKEMSDRTVEKAEIVYPIS